MVKETFMKNFRFFMDKLTFLSISYDIRMQKFWYIVCVVEKYILCQKTAQPFLNQSKEGPGEHLQSCKVLIRSILEYAPFITTILHQTNLEKIDRIQRAAVRIATYWPPGICTSEMNKRVKLESLIDKALLLTEKYLYYAYETNSLIKSTIDGYWSSHQLDDCSHAKRKPRLTVLGILKLKENLSFNSLFT